MALADDLPALVDTLGQRPYFVDRLARQRAGQGILLVAWHAFAAVGDVYLRLEAAEEPELRERLPEVPLLTHLEVVPEHRNRRIGTRLVEEAERRLRDLGHARVALGVDLDNQRAHALYRRLGYQEWEHPPVLTTRLVHRSDGTVEELPDLCHILVKDLCEAQVR